MKTKKYMKIWSSRRPKKLVGIVLLSFLIFSIMAYIVYANGATTYIVLSPKTAPQGATISVSGHGFTQIAGTDLDLVFEPSSYNFFLGTKTTLADGSFTGTFKVPIVPYGVYTVVATDDYGVTTSALLKISTMLVILTDDEGPVGTEVTATGSGLEPGFYDAWFGTIPIVTNGVVSEHGLIMFEFTVPNVSPGTYTVTVEDSWDEVYTTFQVTPGFVIPESPLGTLSVIAAGLTALIIAALRPRLSPRY